MTLTRLIFLVVLGGLTLLLAQNWSPAIPLVFLGLRTQPLPLAMWMLLSTTAGAFTSILISSLLQFSNPYFTQQRQTKSYSTYDSPKVNKRTSRENEPYQKNPTSFSANTPPPSDEFDNTYNDDWDLDRNVNDDWDFSEREYQTTDSRSQYTKIQDDRDYEDFPEAENDYESVDSSYSYNKRDLKNSGIGKTESIYDADYRVIIPPHNPSTTSKGDLYSDSDNEDWGFLDEDFDDDKSPKRQ